MPTKKDLAALLSDTPQPPLRRGRGLRLSQASKQARELVSKSAVSPESASQPDPSAPIVALPADAPVADFAASAAPPISPDARGAKADAFAATPIDSSVLADPEPLKPERDKRKIQLRKDLLKQCKRIARAQDRKLYQVIELALEEYIQRHGAPE
jgi:hypothetical protein